MFVFLPPCWLIHLSPFLPLIDQLVEQADCLGSPAVKHKVIQPLEGGSLAGQTYLVYTHVNTRRKVPLNVLQKYIGCSTSDVFYLKIATATVKTRYLMMHGCVHSIFSTLPC